MAESALPRRRRALIALATAAALTACGKSGAPQFKAIDITGADYARELELTDADGRVRRLSDFKGKVTVVFFGFTHCPDVCPTTLLELAAVRKALSKAGSDGDKLQGIFVTIDPERDTPQVLKAYVDNFGAGFVALRGSPEQTRAVAKHFKVHYAKAPGKTPESYTVDHTAGSFVFDPEGRVRLFTRYGGGAEALQHDVQLLLNER